MVYDGSLSGVKCARTIARRLEFRKCSVDRIKEMMISPGGARERGSRSYTPQTATDVEPVKKTPVGRFYIRQDDLNEHGYTKHCPKCQHIIAHGPSMSPNMSHTAQCRVRATQAVAGTPQGQARIQKLNQKEDMYLAEHLRHHAEDGTVQAQGGE